MANSGLPGTSGFVGEFLVILAAFKANFWYALLAATTLVLGAAYTLWLVKRVIFGPVANDHVAELQDLNGREFLVLGVLAVVGAADRRLAGAAAGRDARLDRTPDPADPGDQAGAAMNDAHDLRTDYLLAMPEIYLAGAICVVLLFDLFFARQASGAHGVFSIAACCWWARRSPGATRPTHVDADPQRALRGRSAGIGAEDRDLPGRRPWRCSTAAAICERKGLQKGEFHVLALTALLGILVLASAATC